MTDAESSPPTVEKPRRRQLPRALVVMAGIGTLLMAIWLGYAFVTDALVTRSDRMMPRDEDTGIGLGAEPVDLGPEDAETAALLIHGFIGGSDTFADLPERLANEGVRVRAMLLPGHGTSPRDFEKTNEQEMLRAVVKELERLKTHHENVVLVGHSMGAALAVIAGAERGVDGLVIGGGFFGVTYYWYYILPAEAWGHLTSPFVRWTPKTDAFIQVNREEVKDEIFTYRWVPAKGTLTLFDIGRRAKSEVVLENVTCPVLMLHGRDDRAASGRQAQKAFEKMVSKDKEFVWLERSNHHVFWDYDQAEVFDRVTNFVTSL